MAHHGSEARRADNAIHWRAPQATPELIALVNDVRELRAVVQVALASADPREVDALTSTLIASPPEACEPPLDVNQPTDVLCKQALEARGPLNQGKARRQLRERARLHLHLIHPFVLHTSQDLLDLWDEATRREPIIRLFVDEPRWRTPEDGLPFTGAQFAPVLETLPLHPGDETAGPADIPALVDEVVAFAARTDLPPEVIAFGMSYLLFRIHPFRDGNGHTLRMLTCSLLHAAGYDLLTLLSYLNLLRERHSDMCELSRTISLGAARTEDHVTFHLAVLRDAQQAVLDHLGILAKTEDSAPLPST